ncbi:MAG: flagellar biosynthesis anti-sigma factor FlgM [Betaproteobacteria bacterium]
MVDLNGISGQQALENRETASKKSSTVKASDQSNAANPDEVSRLQQPDSIELSSEVAKALAAAESFDSEKVEKIKEAIAKGEYPIDPRQIAKSMADLEKLL